MSRRIRTSTEHLTALRERILARFDLEELRTLIFDLNANYDDLRGEIISAKIQALLEYLEKQDRIPDLLALLKQRRPNEDWDNIFPTEPEANSPYKGLQFFDEADAPLFFGREQLTTELVDHLRQHRFLAVVGASGSGKSSVVRAGVVPAVRGGTIVTDDSSSSDWLIHVITPGDEPLKALAASLTRDSESVTATKTLLADLQADTDNLDLFLYRQMGAGNGRLWLVIDQFEELFTQCRDAAAREMFVGNLVTAVNSGQQGRLRLILTLRADFYSHAVQFDDLRPLLETRQKIVGAMTSEELRQAVEGPASRGNWVFQAGLVDTILQDVGREPGALPLLSHALQETWARREGRTLTLAGYQAAGGVRRAIAHTADTVFTSLTPEQQAITRNIVLRLTELGEGTEDTRRRVAIAELLPDKERKTAISEVLDLLARKRLVTLDEETEQPYAEVAHEALIREWPMLREWLDENREGLRIQRQVTEAAQAWQANGEDASYLYRGGRLAQAQEWAVQSEVQLNELEQRFLSASQTVIEQEVADREAQRQRELEAAQHLAAVETRRSKTTRRAFIGVSVFLVLAVAAAIYGFVQRNTALEQATTARSQALASASLSVQEKDPIRSLLLAIAAGQMAETALAYDALHGVTPRVALPLHVLQHDGRVYGETWNKDGSLVLTWGEDGTARVWNANSGEETLHLTHDSAVLGGVWNTDDSLILTWSRDNSVRVWDAASGEERQHFFCDFDIKGTVWNGDESLILTWGQDQAQVWDVLTGMERFRFTDGGEVRGATWSKDGTRLLIWREGGTVRVWDTLTGVEQLRLYHEGVYEAAWNEDESLILTSIWDEVRVWDAVTGVEQMKRFWYEDRRQGRISGTAWNEDGDAILIWGCDNDAASCTQGSARVWDAITGTERQRFTHEGQVWGVVWNEDGSQVLTWSDDNTTRLWDATAGVELQRFTHEDDVRGARWNEDESQVLTWSRDGTARLWDVRSGTEQLRLTPGSSVSNATWNGDESLILTHSANFMAQVWGAANGAEWVRATHDGPIGDGVLNGDESLILIWSQDGIVRIWDAADGAKRLYINHGGLINGAAWNEDEKLILTWGCEDSFEYFVCPHGVVRVWDASSGVEKLRLNHEDLVWGAAWNRDESQILTWGRDDTARVWDATSGTELLHLNHDNAVFGAIWNKDESLILTQSGGDTVRVWDASSGVEQLHPSDDDTFYGASWNEDKSLDLIPSGDGTVRVWDASGVERLRLSHSGVGGASWNRDKSLILTWGEDGTARVWDATNGAEQLRLNHEDSVYGAIWNVDENLILTWSEDGTAQMWDAATGDIVFTLTGDGTPVMAAQLSQDERRILYVTRGGLTGIFYIQMADLLEAACQRTTRNFTWQEWQLYFPGQPYRVICPQWPVDPSVPQE